MLPSGRSTVAVFALSAAAVCAYYALAYRRRLQRPLRVRLIIACRDGMVEDVSRLLQLAAAGLGLEAALAPDAEWAGVTALYACCLAGQARCAELVLAAGAAADAACATGDTPMHIACQGGHARCVELLLGAGASADLGRDNDEVSPLLLSCQNGHPGCVDALLKGGAAVDKANPQGLTPLYVSCGRGHAECAVLLLAAGADANRARDDDGSSPLFIAAQHGHAACARLLLAGGAETEAANKNGVTAMAISCFAGRQGCARLLSAYGAARSILVEGSSRRVSVYELASDQGHTELHAWLVRSAPWTDLHHVEALPLERARALCRAEGAGPRLRARPRLAQRGLEESLAYAFAAGATDAAIDVDGTPLDVARAVLARSGEAAASAEARAVAELLLLAASPWSAASHGLFPESARAYAASLLRPLYALALDPRMAGGPPPSWFAHAVIAHLVERPARP